MCGIAGVFAYHDAAPPVDREELLRIRDAMIARGPDGAGLWISADGRTGLAHRRLAIIDLSEAGAQPMATADGRLHVTFNGEIYNYRELRKRTGGEGLSLPLRLRHRGPAPSLCRPRSGHGACASRDVRLRDLGRAREGAVPRARSRSASSRSTTPTTAKRSASRRRSRRCSRGARSTRRPSRPGRSASLSGDRVPEPYTLYRGIRSLPAGAYMRVSARRRRID